MHAQMCTDTKQTETRPSSEFSLSLNQSRSKRTDSATLVQFSNIQSMIQSSVSKLLIPSLDSCTPTGFTTLSSKTKLTALQAHTQPFCQTAKKQKKTKPKQKILKVEKLNIKEYISNNTQLDSQLFCLLQLLNIHVKCCLTRLSGAEGG